MVKKILVATIISLGLLGQNVYADTKIGVVNPDRILRESDAAKAAQKKLTKEFASRQNSISVSAKQLKADVEKFQKEAGTLSPTERLNRERNLADQERRLQRRERELREDLNRRRNEELQSILMRSNKIIREIAEREKYDLIVQEAVYVGPNVDLTEKVIKALGK